MMSRLQFGLDCLLSLLFDQIVPGCLKMLLIEVIVMQLKLLNLKFLLLRKFLFFFFLSSYASILHTTFVHTHGLSSVTLYRHLI